MTPLSTPQFTVSQRMTLPVDMAAGWALTNEGVMGIKRAYAEDISNAGCPRVNYED